MSEGQYASEAELLRDAMDALDRLEEDRLLRWPIAIDLRLSKVKRANPGR